MKGKITRLLVSLVLPSAITSTLLFLFMITSALGTAAVTQASGFDLAVYWGYYLAYGCCAGAIPAVIFWAGLEVYWRRVGPVTRDRFAAAGGMIAVLGGLAIAGLLALMQPKSALALIAFPFAAGIGGYLGALVTFRSLAKASRENRLAAVPAAKT